MQECQEWAFRAGWTKEEGQKGLHRFRRKPSQLGAPGEDAIPMAGPLVIQEDDRDFDRLAAFEEAYMPLISAEVNFNYTEMVLASHMPWD